MVVGLQQLRTHFDTYEQFVGHLCTVFEIYNVRSSLWNGTLNWRASYQTVANCSADCSADSYQTWYTFQCLIPKGDLSEIQSAWS